MKKVILGVSGGVDSSVALIKLIEQGYQVEGLFMRNWDSSINNDIEGNPNLNNNICPQEEDYNDALKVCNKFNIKLHRIDFIKEYWDYVFTYFLDELNKGRTPNPDIMCNKYIKFDMFYKEAIKLGADYIATGHYARVIDSKLCKAVDSNKDQTYFLSQVNRDVFNKVLFPIGDMNKTEVREIALKYDLVTATKKDSTGICFIGERNFQKFLHNYLPNQPGDIINIETKENLGKHTGLMYYTIGQRRGLDVGGTKERLFVIGKDLKNNILYVAENNETKYLVSDMAIMDTINWLNDIRPTSCYAKFRYRQLPIPVTAEYFDDHIIVKYPQGIKAVTPGQACVLYYEEKCIVGGLVKEIYKNNEKMQYL